MAEPDELRKVAPGYPAFQIAKALMTSQDHPDPTTRARAQDKIVKWTTVLAQVLDGSVTYGSRTPLKNTPAWATLELLTGGFATGELLANGPLREHERELLKRLSPVPEGHERGALNGWFLTDAGLEDLRQKLRTALYDVTVPEEGALLVVAWLVEKGHTDSARALLEELSPHFSTLRFYPVPADCPRRFGSTVHLQDVAATIRDLSTIEPKREILLQKEAVEVWAPFRDRMVALFLETVVDDWPCRSYPPGWAQRAAGLVAEYTSLREKHQLCREPDREGSHFFQLRRFLARCATNPSELTGREVGRVRMMLRRYQAKYGLPGSVKCAEFRRRQREDVSAPMFHEIAAVVISRLKPHAKKEGLDDVAFLQSPVATDEAASAGIPAGTPVPESMRNKVARCLNETAAELIRRGLITSGDTLARILPQLTSGLRAASISDPELRQLYAAIYAAFRRRRSLLLLNLEKQIQLEELPWVAAIDCFRETNLSAAELARQTMEEIVILTLISFPHAIIPNKLLQELRALGKSAGMDLPLVEEVAADIFMGKFSPKFVRAAKTAGELLSDSFYAQYYGIDYRAVQNLKDTPAAKEGPVKRLWARVAGSSDDLAEICRARAGVQGGSPAKNGMIIEQQQIITTQNLAVLFQSLGLQKSLRNQFRPMAETCFKWICERQQMKINHFHARLIMVKNTAYAWRQMVFYLSMIPAEERTAFLQWAEERLERQDREFRRRFDPAFSGLLQAGNGSKMQDDSRQFLGWSENHWLLPREEKGTSGSFPTPLS